MTAVAPGPVTARGTLLDVLTYASEHGHLNEGDTIRIHAGDETYDVTAGKVERPKADTPRLYPTVTEEL